MTNVKEMLDLFYTGRIEQSDLDVLFDAFLYDGSVREEYPTDASVIIPLAIARKDRHPNPKAIMRHRTVRVAAAIFGITVATASFASVYVMGRQPQIYSTDANCDIVCANRWLNSTIETAL